MRVFIGLSVLFSDLPVFFFPGPVATICGLSILITAFLASLSTDHAGSYDGPRPGRPLKNTILYKIAPILIFNTCTQPVISPRRLDACADLQKSSSNPAQILNGAKKRNLTSHGKVFFSSGPTLSIIGR